MTGTMKLLLIKASPNDSGIGWQIKEELKKFISEQFPDFQLSIFDQAKENDSPVYRHNSLKQFVKADNREITLFERLITENDGIILFSPVYIRHTPGEFKLTLDSFAYRLHEFPLVGKKIIILTYAMSTGADDLAHYFRNTFMAAGAEVIAAQPIILVPGTLEGQLEIFEEQIKKMIYKIKNNIYTVTKSQEKLFQYYKGVVRDEISQGVITNKQKKWESLLPYKSLCAYLESINVKE
ncbi:NAD(P)H-dependent oxidoreductase [Streptococcus sp. H31]|uniref:NAD(P)H-dependent oxidoreductase n=1 Tax=Streptococcus huangxiaojuni TaxID=3237239 RepID=UPI0034A1CDCC